MIGMFSFAQLRRGGGDQQENNVSVLVRQIRQSAGQQLVIDPRPARRLLRLSRSRAFKAVGRVAPWAVFRLPLALQFGKLPLIEAVRAQKVRGILVGVRILEAAHNVTGWRFPALISLRLLVKVVNLQQGHFDRRKLLMQFCVRHFRLLNLQGEFGNGGSRFAVASALRTLEKPCDYGHALGNRGSRFGPLGQDFYRVADFVCAEIHLIEVQCCPLRTVLDQIGKKIKEISENSKAGTHG